MILCTQCGHSNADDAKHCAACSAPLPEMTTCPSCQSSVPVDAWFCAHCGTSLRSHASEPNSAEIPASPTVNPLAPTDVAGLSQPQESQIPPTDVISAAGSFEDSSSTVPATEVVNPNISISQPPDLLADEEPEPPPPISAESPPPISAESPPPISAESPPPISAEPPPPISAEPPPISAEPPPPISAEPSAEFTTFPDFDTSDSPSASEVIGGAESQNGDRMPPDPPPIESAGSDEFIPPSTTPKTAPVSSPSPPIGATQLQQPMARLVHIRSETELPIPTHLHVVHLGKPNDRVPPDLDVSGFPDSDVVSRVHADLRLEADGYYLEDAGSANGTYVNNQALRSGDRYRLRTGDRVSLGKEDKVSFIFHAG